MIVTRGYKTELKLNNKQRTTCVRHAGTARWAYNWGLARKISAHEQEQKVPSAIDLHRELNQLKKTDLHWLYSVSKCAPQEALRDLDKAFQNFFRRLKEGAKEAGFPKFKSKKRGYGSFRLTGTIKVFEKHIQLPRLGKLRVYEADYLPQNAHILSATVSEIASRWYVSLQVREEIPDPLPATHDPLGIDLGVKVLATCSDGQKFPNPKALAAKTKQLVRWQRRLSRRQPGGRNREKARYQIAKIHAQIANIRRDTLHKTTSAIISKRPSRIVLEDLNVHGMLQNHRLARVIADAGFHEFRRQLTYKAAWAGIEVRIADRFYPSSKRCSRCGAVKTALRLAERTYHCDSCGLIIDRDLNAALNLEQWNTASSAGIDACGQC